MRSFFTAMKLCKKQIVEIRDRDAAIVYKDLVDFVKSGVYSTYKGIERLATTYVEGGNDKVVAEQLGISEVTARIHKRNASLALYKLLGNDFFDLLIDYKENKEEIDTRMKLLLSHSIKASEILPYEVYNKIKGDYIQKGDSDYSLNDCRAEISFIKTHLLQNIDMDIAMLDSNKLHYILAMISGEVGTRADRYQLITNELIG